MSRLGFAGALAISGALIMLVGDNPGWWAGLALVAMSVVSLIFSRGKEHV